MTQLPNPFLNSSVISPRTEVSTADSEYRLQNVARPDVTAERDPHLIQSSDGGVEGHAQSHALGLPPKYNRCGKRKPEGALPEGFGASKDEPAGIKPGPSEALPSNEGRPEEASAPAPTKNPDADALGTEFIHEIFFYARKLMTNYPGFVLDEARFLADIEELPMFLREDGYLKRQA